MRYMQTCKHPHTSNSSANLHAKPDAVFSLYTALVQPPHLISHPQSSLSLEIMHCLGIRRRHHCPPYWSVILSGHGEEECIRFAAQLLEISSYQLHT